MGHFSSPRALELLLALGVLPQHSMSFSNNNPFQFTAFEGIPASQCRAHSLWKRRAIMIVARAIAWRFTPVMSFSNPFGSSAFYTTGLALLLRCSFSTCVSARGACYLLRHTFANMWNKDITWKTLSQTAATLVLYNWYHLWCNIFYRLHWRIG